MKPEPPQSAAGGGYSATEALRVLADHPQLHDAGYGPLPANSGYQFDQAKYRADLMRPESLAVITRVAEWCSSTVPVNINRKHSYGLKHDAENDLGEYVSNGQLITAMLLAGYEIRERGYNPCFRPPVTCRAAGKGSSSARRGKLSIDEGRLLKDIAESHKAFGMWPADPQMVPLDIAVRAAECAYRRGVVQGAYFMLWHLRPETQDGTGRVSAFLSRLERWRTRGARQEYAKAELPPEGNAR